MCRELSEHALTPPGFTHQPEDGIKQGLAPTTPLHLLNNQPHRGLTETFLQCLIETAMPCCGACSAPQMFSVVEQEIYLPVQNEAATLLCDELEYTQSNSIGDKMPNEASSRGGCFADEDTLDAKEASRRRLDNASTDVAKETCSQDACFTREDKEALKAVEANQRRVLLAIAAAKKGEEWENVGRIGGTDCFVSAVARAQGHLGVMGRGKVMASREAILKLLSDPSVSLDKRQRAELIKPLPLSAAEADDTQDSAKGGGESQASLQWIGLNLPLMTDRDFSVASMARALAGNEGEWIVGATSVEHPLVSERTSFCRGEVLTQGWHIKPLASKSGEPCCGVTVVSVTDLKTSSMASTVLNLGQMAGGQLISQLMRKLKDNK